MELLQILLKLENRDTVEDTIDGAGLATSSTTTGQYLTLILYRATVAAAVLETLVTRASDCLKTAPRPPRSHLLQHGVLKRMSSTALTPFGSVRM